MTQLAGLSGSLAEGGNFDVVASEALTAETLRELNAKTEAAAGPLGLPVTDAAYRCSD